MRISATFPVGDLEAEVAVHKENFIHGFSLHQVPNYLLYLFLTSIYIEKVTTKLWAKNPIKNFSRVVFKKIM